VRHCAALEWIGAGGYQVCLGRWSPENLRRAWDARNKSDLKAAITYYQKAIAIDPEFCAALNDLGTAYLQTDQLDLAIEQFNKAIVVDAHAAKPNSDLAIAYLRQDRYANAERAARRALDLDRVSTHGH
jgi:tetratricopeptide (TPR) repeat protein